MIFVLLSYHKLSKEINLSTNVIAARSGYPCAEDDIMQKTFFFFFAVLLSFKYVI